MEKCYLLDLERSIKTGMTTYWKPNKHGYTVDVETAGLYSSKEARNIADSDIDNRTVVIDSEVIDNIL